jgi:hypothetical protein
VPFVCLCLCMYICMFCCAARGRNALLTIHVIHVEAREVSSMFPSTFGMKEIEILYIFSRFQPLNRLQCFTATQSIKQLHFSHKLTLSSLLLGRPRHHGIKCESIQVSMRVKLVRSIKHLLVDRPFIFCHFF